MGSFGAAGLTTGQYNTFMGYQVANSTTTASGSVFLGWGSGGNVTIGNHNIAIGQKAMNAGSTTGDNNIAIGANAGDALTSGANNILIGKDAGGALTSGINNVLMGNDAGRTTSRRRTGTPMRHHGRETGGKRGHGGLSSDALSCGRGNLQVDAARTLLASWGNREHGRLRNFDHHQRTCSRRTPHGWHV